jgi:nucleotidyltransferase substrate binding protein (TIGR01987 family)
MKNEERWLQRLQNLNKAFSRLQSACEKQDYNELEVAGLVQTYEFTFELCWKTMKDKLNFEGYGVNSPRSTIRKAYEMELIEDVDTWLEALESRNLFSHTYDDAMAKQAVDLIKDTFAPMLSGCVTTLNRLAETE